MIVLQLNMNFGQRKQPPLALLSTHLQHHLNVIRIPFRPLRAHEARPIVQQRSRHSQLLRVRRRRRLSDWLHLDGHIDAGVAVLFATRNCVAFCAGASDGRAEERNLTIVDADV